MNYRTLATPTVRFDKNTKPGSNLLDQEDSDGIYSAPELPSDKHRDKGMSTEYPLNTIKMLKLNNPAIPFITISPIINR